MKVKELLESTDTITVPKIIKDLSRELKGKKISAFGKNSRGLWGSNPEPIEFTIKSVSLSYFDDDDDDSSAYATVDVNLTGYSSTKHGLIYTDPAFIKNLKALLKTVEAGSKIKSINYSEQGMQKSGSVNFDVSFKKLK